MEKLEDIMRASVKTIANDLKTSANRNMKWAAYNMTFAGIDGAWGFDRLMEGKYGMAAFLFGFGALMAVMGRAKYKDAKKDINILESLAVKSSEIKY